MQSVIVSSAPEATTMTGLAVLGGESDAPRVSVTSVDATGTRLEATVEYTRDLRPFFDEQPFYVDYDADVSGVPDSILTIPVLAQVCPVAWAHGADVHVPVVDRRFLDSLQTVGAVLAEMYPFIEGGRIVVDHAPETEATDDVSGASEDRPHGSGMLFTGGVDSLAAYVRNREGDPTLITVKGWVVDVENDERWRNIRARTERFADRFGVDAQFVRSNMLEFLDTPMLSAHFDDKHDGGWYSAVGCGLGMSGLCSPLTVAEGMDSLYIAASVWQGMDTPPVVNHWDGRAMPWGSHPDIDGNVAWADTDVVHDAFEYNRQERIEVIADYVRDGHPDLPVYSCSNSDRGDNCGRCEKCIRTALGLALAGLDPADHGFDVDGDSFAHAIEQFEEGNWLNDQHAPYHWQYFQTHVPPDADLGLEGDTAFRQWLGDADFEAIAGGSSRNDLLRAAARHTPYPVYARLYPVYSAAKRRFNGK